MAEEDPIKILKIRLAKGEITTTQFQEMITYLLDDIPANPVKYEEPAPTLPAESSICDPVDSEPSQTQSAGEPLNIAISVDPVHAKMDYDSDEPLEDDPIPDDVFPSDYLKDTSKPSDTEKSDVQSEDQQIPESQYLSDAASNAGIIPESRILEEQLEALEIIDEFESDQQAESGAIPGVSLSGQELGNVCYATAVNLVQA